MKGKTYIVWLKVSTLVDTVKEITCPMWKKYNLQTLTTLVLTAIMKCQMIQYIYLVNICIYSW